MNKSELVAKMADVSGLTKVQAEKALAAFTGSVEAALKAGDKVALIGFGTFSAVERKARIGRNPQTGKELEIAAKTSGKFTPGASLKDLTPPKAAAPAEKVAPAKAKAPAAKAKAKK